LCRRRVCCNRHVTSYDPHMTTLVEKVIAEEHHLEEIVADGYQPATLAVVLGAIMLAVAVLVALALGVTLAVYYWV